MVYKIPPWGEVNHSWPAAYQWEPSHVFFFNLLLFIVYPDNNDYVDRAIRNRVFEHMRTAKAQISLRIDAV